MANCNHGNCSHEHNKESFSKGDTNLYLKIELDKVQCYNEMVRNSGKTVIKPWDNRLDKGNYVESDVDQELLFNIPYAIILCILIFCAFDYFGCLFYNKSIKFNGMVRLKSLVIIGGEGSTHPSEIQLFKDRLTMSFDDTSMKADQAFKLQPDTDGSLDYTVKASVFSSIHHLSIYIPKSFGAEHTKVYFIGLFGDFLRPFRQEIAIFNYEKSANPCDHKVGQDLPSQCQIR